ncbi:hypothetical protein NECAME_09773 [Necator americanus]|nr:hypothetical protein NECAME_09773 [Necator americanus]ETN79564.1 hypothetical protein NECAME_09773 [Necator americanus]
MSSDPKLSISEWVARTCGWTGAELKALITNAGFDAMRRMSNGSSCSVIVKDSNIAAVFHDSLPQRHNRIKKQLDVGIRLTHS